MALIKIEKYQIDKYLIPTMVISLKDKDILNIPTQIGCPVNCVFCPSAKSKFIRNLTDKEMIYLIEKALSKNKNTLISFTGEGESILNYKNVNNVIGHFDNNPHIIEFRICLSGYRSANLDKIKTANTKLELQFSMHSPIDSKRLELMEKTEPLNKVFSSIERNKHKFDTIAINYVLVEGFNDSIEDLHLLKKINKNYIIKLNPLLSEEGKSIPNQNTDLFYDILKGEGFEVFKFSKIGSSMDNKLNDLSYSIAA